MLYRLDFSILVHAEKWLYLHDFTDFKPILLVYISLCAAQLKEMTREDGSPFRSLYALNFLFKWIKYPLNKTVIVLKG